MKFNSMRINLLPIPVFLLFLCSCNTRTDSPAASVINIDIAKSITVKGEVKVSEIAEDIEFIQLETLKECLINAEKSECFIAGQYILVISRKPCNT